MIEPLKTQPILDSDGYKFSHYPQYPQARGSLTRI
jgi:hypothetical protein